MTRPIAIIGIGNPLLRDEGAGIHAIERLRKLPWPPEVELLDGGTAGLALLHLFEGRRLAIIIDCADFGGRPGEIRSFDPSELRREDRPISGLHATDPLTALELARRAGSEAGHTVIIGIQPQAIGMGRELSPEVARSLEELPEILRREMNLSFLSPSGERNQR